MKRQKLIVTSAIGLLFLMPSPAHSIEIVVTGNGDGSANEVQVEAEKTKNITQNNESNVTNDIKTEANTGNNNASQNSGDAKISTGDISAEVEVKTETNQSVVNEACCADGGCCKSQNTTITVSGNGANTTNTATVETKNKTNVAITNSQNIYSEIKGVANTGKNSATGNNGNVKITTGSITAVDKIITNGNSVFVSVSEKAGSLTLNIKNNGANSKNTINFEDESGIDIRIDNRASINNKSIWDLNTGGNIANDNNGDVEIITGSIAFESSILTNVNKATVVIDCCDTTYDPPSDPPANNPQDPPVDPNTNNPPSPKNGNGDGNGNNSGNGSGNSNGSSVGGTSAGAILPATGMSWWLYATIANIIMFLLGLYLRLRAGRSPARV